MGTFGILVLGAFIVIVLRLFTAGDDKPHGYGLSGREYGKRLAEWKKERGQ